MKTRNIVDFIIFLVGMVILGFVYFIIEPVIVWYEQKKRSEW